MVLELQFWNRFRITHLVLIALLLGWSDGDAAESGEGYLRDAQALYRSGQYYSAARYAFRAKDLDPGLTADAYSWVTLGLVRAQLYQAASYFFIRTLQTGESSAIRRVLTETETLFSHVGSDVLRKYLIRHTQYGDYDVQNRSAYFYALGRFTFLSGEPQKAIEFLSGVQPKSSLYPFAIHLRGSAYALVGRPEQALQDFDLCSKLDPTKLGSEEAEAEDLNARCQAGKARIFYETEKFEQADLAYDRVPKVSRVWPNILFEQAWNSFARGELNRTLGKLVSYKSPALSFVFNPEIEVLRAQSYLALCLYSDANTAITAFQSRYEPEGQKIKAFLETNTGDLNRFYELGYRALTSSAESGLGWVLYSYVRGPYFKSLYNAQKAIVFEMQNIQLLDSSDSGLGHARGQGFSGFLSRVLEWRSQSIRTLGGSYIKNGLLDYYSELLSNLDKMSFIKLEMLKRSKDRLLQKSSRIEFNEVRSRGNVKPQRRDYQYYWNFNGEFWNDELGDYVFGLESECKGGEGV